MKPTTVIQLLVLVMILLGSSVGMAETQSQVVNGATCIGYPPYTLNGGSSPYQYLLFGFGQSAFCHFTMPNGWTAQNLSYVLIQGTVSADVLKMRLCVHDGLYANSCGPERTLTPGMTVNWVAPPSPIPLYHFGAYVALYFPNGQVSTIRQLVPVWSK